jgi:hypothetical protein
MSKKKNTNTIITITAEQRFAAEKPRYNPYQTGHGAHGKAKYSRKQKHKGQEQ